ncbi:hypothetical protein SKAU_G00368430 [Synaphobranchus kaupii]|uniref:Uncharacterized protein n=1 Tax=Synaphobranchus kaupii TaxID=118154 RepID=A0A9Q1IFJ8_SYNKA|nr:hypothetical protein SKAU_G00368430 [Synaphobranchus kaupii]
MALIVRKCNCHMGRGQKKQYRGQLKTAMKKYGLNLTQPEDSVAQRAIWRQLCHQGVRSHEEERKGRRTKKRLKQG